jgi:carbon starvation protein
MATLLIALGAGVAFVVAYHTYGRWLGSKIFNLAADAVCPSVRLRDDVDYCPTAKSIVFGHHFTSIAGTGPIVGPAIAVMWGWLPALLWVVFGSIFIGAVHDFGALVVSLRNNGQTVGEIAGRVLNRRVRVLFLLVLFLSLTIVLAIFGLVIAAVFRKYPEAIFPCLIQIPIAVIIGVWLHRRGVSLLLPSIIALTVMYVTVIYGDVGVLGGWNDSMAGWSNITWVAVLLAYSYVASVLPVWTLLQPRDYINSLQLLTALGLVVVGLVIAALFGGAAATTGGARPALEIVAPAWNFHPSEAPLIFPFLFITIACGAVSGFHCLVSSGTSSKQLMSEPDARFVGYGSMLTEGFLATIVILACVAGLGLGSTTAKGEVITGTAAWAARYASWTAADTLGAKVGAFVDGSANFLMAMGIPAGVARALMGVLVASFAGTTLDTACRLQRYVVQGLGATLHPRRGGLAGGQAMDSSGRVNPVAAALGWLGNKHVATILAVVIAFILAAMPVAGASWSMQNAGKGGLILWPMFGATNQLLAGLSFLVVSFYLWRRRKPVIYFVLPMIFMLIMPAWAMLTLIPQWLDEGSPNWTLIIVAVITLVLEAWMLIEAVLLWPRVRGVVESELAATAVAEPAGGSN